MTTSYYEFAQEALAAVPPEFIHDAKYYSACQMALVGAYVHGVSLEEWARDECAFLKYVTESHIPSSHLIRLTPWTWILHAHGAFRAWKTGISSKQLHKLYRVAHTIPGDVEKLTPAQQTNLSLLNYKFRHASLPALWDVDLSTIPEITTFEDDELLLANAFLAESNPFYQEDLREALVLTHRRNEQIMALECLHRAPEHWVFWLKKEPMAVKAIERLLQEISYADLSHSIEVVASHFMDSAGPFDDHLSNKFAGRFADAIVLLEQKVAFGDKEVLQALIEGPDLSHPLHWMHERLKLPLRSMLPLLSEFEALRYLKDVVFLHPNNANNLPWWLLRTSGVLTGEAHSLTVARWAITMHRNYSDYFNIPEFFHQEDKHGRTRLERSLHLVSGRMLQRDDPRRVLVFGGHDLGDFIDLDPSEYTKIHDTFGTVPQWLLEEDGVEVINTPARCYEVLKEIADKKGSPFTHHLREVLKDLLQWGIAQHLHILHLWDEHSQMVATIPNTEGPLKGSDTSIYEIYAPTAEGAFEISPLPLLEKLRSLCLKKPGPFRPLDSTP